MRIVTFCIPSDFSPKFPKILDVYQSEYTSYRVVISAEVGIV